MHTPSKLEVPSVWEVIDAAMEAVQTKKMFRLQAEVGEVKDLMGFIIHTV